jgi:hypothetical protein
MRWDYDVHWHCQPARFAELADAFYYFVELSVRALHQSVGAGNPGLLKDAADGVRSGGIWADRRNEFHNRG